MGQKETVERTPAPLTVTSLSTDLRALGLGAAHTVLVHSSLSAIGWVAGGAQAVVLALEEVVGSEGTVVMPSHSNHLTDPAGWSNPPVPESWHEVIRSNTPAFDVDMTPAGGMGAIVDCFRSQPDTVRSNQPRDSICARGPLARRITDGHSLAFGLGEKSPLARLFDLDALVLLLGVGHAANTSFHLAEYRAEWPSKRVIAEGAPVLIEGERRWERFQDVELNADDFATIGAAFERDTDAVRAGLVGLAECRLMSQQAAVDYAVTWIEANRT